LPLDDRSPFEILLNLAKERSALAAPRTTFTYYPHTFEVPEAAAPNIRNCSYTVRAEVDIDAPNAEGVVLAQGSRFGGHSLFIKNHALFYVYNFLGITEQQFISNVKVPMGKVILSAEFTKEKEEPLFVANGTLKLYINNDVVAEGKMKSQPGAFGLAGRGLVVGRQSADPVSTEYTPPFKFTGGTIQRVSIDASGEGLVDLETEVMAMLEPRLSVWEPPAIK
jgi:arylsulfatase